MLVGELVTLRPMTAADRESLYLVARDPLVWEVHPAHDRWQRDVFDAFFDAGLASGGGLVIIDRADGAIVGSSRYDNWKAERDEIEIGWTYIARSHWGGAYNAEIKRLMLDHMFRQVGTVVFTVGETNIRSRRAMEKIGGVLRDCFEIRTMAGEAKRHVVYEIRRP